MGYKLVHRVESWDKKFKVKVHGVYGRKEQLTSIFNHISPWLMAIIFVIWICLDLRWGPSPPNKPINQVIWLLLIYIYIYIYIYI
jgi:hypothetical protein